MVWAVGLPLEPDGVPGGESPGDGREEPEDEVQADPRDQKLLSAEDEEEDSVEEERDRREEAVPVGVARKGELKHALLRRGRGLGRLNGLRRLRLFERRPECRLGGRPPPRSGPQ